MAKPQLKLETDSNLDDVGIEAKISAFAMKLGEDTENNYTCYVYRVIKDEETGKQRKPYVTKYVGIEPDQADIAERFRGGFYYLHFVWRENKEQRTKSFNLEIDSDVFPPLPKSNPLLPMLSNNSNMSESMQLQLATISAITEVMKSAYSTTGSGRPLPAADPMEQFAGMMEAMETGYTRAMAIQQQVMERVMIRNMENKFGIADATPSALEQDTPAPGLVEQYAPLVKEIIDGIKSITAFFGDKVPTNVVKQVKTDDRFKTLLKDKQALVCIGQALRKEFGTPKASQLMETFGVRMVERPKPGETVKTPDIPAVSALKIDQVTPVSPATNAADAADAAKSKMVGKGKVRKG
jgi:hypothetical protein